MRKVIDAQMQFGQVDISAIEFDLRSRDEIPKLLMGLQYIVSLRQSCVSPGFPGLRGADFAERVRPVPCFSFGEAWADRPVSAST